MSDTMTPASPVLSVTRGNPTPEELAALVLVVAAASGGGGTDEAGPRGIWASRARTMGVRPMGARQRSSWAWRAGSFR